VFAVDGVLNSTHPPFTGGLDPQCLGRFAALVSQSKAKIVLSTSWRLLPKLKAELGAHLAGAGLDLGLLVGQTPERVGSPRSAEIVEWVTAHEAQVASWVVLDDIFMDPVRSPAVAGHAVQTVGQLGLQDHDKDAAARILDGELLLGRAGEAVDQCVLAGNWG